MVMLLMIVFLVVVVPVELVVKEVTVAYRLGLSCCVSAENQRNGRLFINLHVKRHGPGPVAVSLLITRLRI